MALANHETLCDVGVDAAFSETSLKKVPVASSRKDVTSRARDAHSVGLQYQHPSSACLEEMMDLLLRSVSHNPETKRHVTQ